MTNVAIMQPYVFPYIGYFQLINAVDKFVFYDDVNFIKQGWIHRNRILLSGKAHLITFPCDGTSPNKLINQIHLVKNEIGNNKLIKTIEAAYKKAPLFDEIFPIVLNVINSNKNLISELAISSVKAVLEYLGIRKEIIVGSKIIYDRKLDTQAKILDICKKIGTDCYINMVGGKELYDYDRFKQENIQLKLLKPNINTYKQFKNDFIGSLSIIDVLMFNDKDSVFKMLNSFDLVS